ncbi:acyl-CoA dehydrogenase [Knoellia sp. Soil729]|uniref:acyl-CoA dehydrogenase n=1 Tax=Knoellia sp. Soil729 TaxID=1736394 RepID=UPI000AAD82E5|nr:acyl-CoA dehydrogenase [Knoellia sp. Soil729]
MVDTSRASATTPSPREVRLEFTFLDWADANMVAAARTAGPDVDAALALARNVSPDSSWLGRTTWAYLRVLGSLGAGDLTVARVIEPHLDALTILAQAAEADGHDFAGGLPGLTPSPSSTWGVYAAHAPGERLLATVADGEWSLSGSKPWCSLADRVSHAIITAHVDDERRRAFVVDLSHPGVRLADAPWVSRGLAAVRSTGLHLHAVPATPVGPVGWYLSRPGFSWGGIAVAAVWFGAASALAQAVLAGARSRTPDQVAMLHLGRLDGALRAAELELRAAAAAIDAGMALGNAGELVAARARNAAAAAAELALTETARALGPAPLTFREEHARRVADLTVYVRQHHGERDLVRSGTLLLGGRA